MDLAAIYEKYQVIINLVSGLVLAGAGYLFGKWDSERKRKWELDDREYKRRSEIYDMRIQEAREYVDRLSTYPEILGQFTSILKESITKSEVEREFEVYRDVFLSFLPKMLELSTKGASIEILNDGEIKNLF